MEARLTGARFEWSLPWPNTVILMAMRDAWLLDESVTFLNHGSFGACPRVVLARQSELRVELERDPVRFFVHALSTRLDAARERAAAFVGTDPEGFAFVRNATEGCNAVLRSLRLGAGDELLVTSHGYNAVSNAARFVAARAGARVIIAEVPFPPEGPDAVTDAVLAACGPRTRLAIVDHVTSPTGLVFPVGAIATALHARGIDLLVDGAHAPGMLGLEISALGAAYYVGNFHKWTCAPKGAAFLWVHADRREGVHPAVVSHGYNLPNPPSRFRAEFDWTGTADPTPWLCVPTAIDAVAALGGGWDAVRASNRRKALAAREHLHEALGVTRSAPASMIGALASVPLPDGPPAPMSALYADPLHQRLYERERIQVPVAPWPAPPKRLLRVSAHLYNDAAEYERLASALQAALADEEAERA